MQSSLFTRLLILFVFLFPCSDAFAEAGQEDAPLAITEAPDQPLAQDVAPAEVPTPAEGYKLFEQWLDEFRAEALSKGISQDVLDDAFADIDEPSESVLEHDQTQPEVKKTFTQYMKGVLTARKISAARAAWQANKTLLDRIEYDYGVPPQVLVALWGVESNFGKLQGSYSIVQSLATLAFDGRRSDFFRAQLLDALRILQQEHIPAAELTGSWAGAMGQVQFMPSSFLAFAVDYDGDGRKNIWTSTPDALASMANYLRTKGWDGNKGWGVAVSLPQESRVDWRSLKERLPISVWKKYGVRQRDGSMLAGVREEGRLVLLDDSTDNAYLVYPNYDVLMDWNRSTYFATTVSMLADALGEEP